jgi:hypothetical protein
MRKALLKKLEADDIAVVEDALNLLLSEKQITLSALFTIKKSKQQGDLIYIPLLETLLKKHIHQLSASVLSKIVEVSFRESAEGYHVTLLIIDEFIQRGDKHAQNTTIKNFIVAKSVYKPGQSQNVSYVYDQLMNSRFQHFQSEPLVFLLQWWQNKSISFLYSDLRSKMEILIPWAIQKTRVYKTFKHLLKILEDYLLKGEYSKSLLDQLEEKMPEQFLMPFEAWKRNRLRKILRKLWLQALIADLQSQNLDRITQSIHNIDELSPREWTIASHAYREIVDHVELKWHAKTKLLYKFIAQDEDKVFGNLIIKMVNEDWLRFKEQMNNHYEAKALVSILRTALNIGAINHLIRTVALLDPENTAVDNKALDEFTEDNVNFMRKWTQSLDGLETHDALGLELAATINYAAGEQQYDCLWEAMKILDDYGGVIDLTARRHHFKTFADEFKTLLSNKSGGQKSRLLKLLVANRYKIKFEPEVLQELLTFCKKQGIVIQ